MVVVNGIAAMEDIVNESITMDGGNCTWEDEGGIS